MRRLLLAAAAVLALTPLAAQAQGTLKIGLREDPDILDPTLGSSYVGRIVYAGMCDKLFDLDAKLNIIPQLATGYKYEDPTHLVITLRAGVTFQDGEKLDAEAVKYSLNRHLTMKRSMRVGEINAIQSIEVVDPLTVRLVLKQPSSPLLAQLTDRSGIIVAPQAAEKAGADFGLHPVCAGPYAFAERVPQDRIVLKRYPGYWNAKDYHFDEVVYLPITNSAVTLANLQAGSMDLAESITPTDIAAVKADPKLKLAIGDGLGYVGINFNVNNGPAAKTMIGENPLVRRAFELSIDRTALIQVVFNGMFTPTAQANPPSSPFYVPSIQPPARDIAAAKALLKQAGVTGRVPVELTVPNSPVNMQAAQVIQSMVAEAGFDLKIRAMEFASSLQAGYAGNFQAYMIGWSGRSDADGNMWALMHTGGTFNYGHHSNPAMDKLLDDARLVTDVAQRRDIYGKVWAIQRQDLPLVYLWTAKNIVGMKKNLDGFVQVPDGLIRLGGLHFSK
ncbi:MAG: ABC transporter substrate-binding protein [Rhodospirillales bacterium]|nr:ABC transporter substrate-binding protein [Rhodospirillales bacterium]